jgi:hypothetical protein
MCDLSDLIGFSLSISAGLQIDDFVYAAPAENVVTRFGSVVKSEMIHEVAKVFKMNIRVGSATQNLLLGCFVFAHATHCGERHC